jgi:hypothetical protein
VLLFLAAGLPLTARERITIQKSGTNQQLRGADSFIDENAPATNFSTAATLEVLARRNRAQRSLVLFDLSAVPNAGIKRALLTLHTTAPVSANAGRVYDAFLVTSFWNEPDVTWTNRVATTPWGAPGGDQFATATAGVTLGLGDTSETWDITADVQSWYDSTPNYGTIIEDSSETANALAVATSFSSSRDATAANRPSLQLTYVQNVQNLKVSSVGSSTITLTWSTPTTLPGAALLEPYQGVLILRRAADPVDKASFPADGSIPALCATVGTGTVVFVNTASNPTTFTDDATDPCGAPANGTTVPITYYYKVFARDAAGNWSSNPSGLAAPRNGGSTFTPEACATPAGGGGRQPFQCAWMLGTHSSNLAAAGLSPGAFAAIGSGINMIFGLNPANGARLYPPISLGGAINGRPPIIDTADSSSGHEISYIADEDNFVYAVDAATGQILWLTNPTGSTTSNYMGSSSVVVKSFAGPSYTLSGDLVVLGTSDTTTTTANRILGLNGNTGATVWSLTGGGGGGIPNLDEVLSSPLIDYKRNTVWISSRSAGGTGQPSLWEVSANTGAIVHTFNLGDSDSSPSITQLSDLIFWGNNAGTLFAIDPATTTPTTLASFSQGDGAIRGFPVPVSAVAPFTIVFSTSTKVQAVSYNAITKTFTPLWSTPISSPSAPDFLGSFIFVGSNDGFVHELLLSTGVDVKDAPASIGFPAVIGDPTVDFTLQQLIVSTTTNDQRVYAFHIPF